MEDLKLKVQMMLRDTTKQYQEVLKMAKELTGEEVVETGADEAANTDRCKPENLNLEIFHPITQLHEKQFPMICMNPNKLSFAKNPALETERLALKKFDSKNSLKKHKGGNSLEARLLASGTNVDDASNLIDFDLFMKNCKMASHQV